MSEPKTCACQSENHITCYKIRYPPPMDDIFRGEYFERLDEDGGCQCGCHEPEYYDDEEDCDE